MYYIEKNGIILLYSEDREDLSYRISTYMPQYSDLEILATERPIKNFQFADTAEYEAEQAQKERARLDMLTLTPSDVERALYTAKGYDFTDLQALIAQQLPGIDPKGLAIEFRASNFYRGATLKDGTRLFDVVGALLEYTPDDMDYLFVNKKLPDVDNSTEAPEVSPDAASVSGDEIVDNL